MAGGDIEYGKCQICGKKTTLRRTYFRYNIKCECHSPQHFDLVIHCDGCIPVRPKETRVLLATKDLEVID